MFAILTCTSTLASTATSKTSERTADVNLLGTVVAKNMFAFGCHVALNITVRHNFAVYHFHFLEVHMKVHLSYVGLTESDYSSSSTS